MDMARGGEVIQLHHGDILVFDASWLSDGTGMVHGVDSIIPRQEGQPSWEHRISIQWRMRLGNRDRHIMYAWALANIAYFEARHFAT